MNGSFEDDLKNALRREEPRAGFAERVTARIEAAPPRRVRWLEWASVRWAAVAAISVLLIGGLEYQRERQVRAQGERAKQQLMLALRITGSKLQMAQEKVLDLSGER